MDIFYEESAANINAKRGEKRYTVFNVVSKICLILALTLLLIAFLSMPTCSTEGLTPEGVKYHEMLRIWFGFLLFTGLFVLALFFYFNYIKSLCNVSYDYAFVSGELRISKVFNVNKRKLVVILDATDILQIGRVDSDSYERLSADPSVREIICTPNKEAADGKDFIYVLAAQNGKQLFVLECRELLVGYMLKFVKRSTLASDYTSSKQGRV